MVKPWASATRSTTWWSASARAGEAKDETPIRIRLRELAKVLVCLKPVTLHKANASSAGQARAPGWVAVRLALRVGQAYDGHHRIIPMNDRNAPSRKEATHERIVVPAAPDGTRGGYDGTGVAAIMRDAGLTHGGFYAHFASREAMLAEAADRAGADGVAKLERIASAAPPPRALQALLRAYLSKAHVERAETGCPVAALGSEMARQAPEVRRSATRRIKELIDLVDRQSPDWGEPGAHERALATVATMVGALVLARAVDDPKLSDAIRDAGLRHIAPDRT
jgi:TetR/AcrR family transcriptional repressor of nem operon